MKPSPPAQPDAGRFTPHSSLCTPPLGLYIHIPFCTTKCSYCDFNTYAGIEPLLPRYIDALIAEMQRYPAGLPVQTINFGGGTPSLLSAQQLALVIEAARARFAVDQSAEISIEANPGALDQAYFGAARQVGVNRVSFGVQSFHASELAVLTRRHSAREAEEALHGARRAGFDNLSLDFMYGLPGQTLATWRRTLQRALDLAPDHLSLYGLTIYDHLPLGRQVARGELPHQDEDLMAAMYELAEDLLAGAGYEQYEISNWSRGERFRCRHNLAYWRNTGYLGIGAGAHSYFEARRYANEKRPNVYCDAVLAGSSPVVDSEPIESELAAAETTILALRLNEGAELTPGQVATLAPCLDAGLIDLERSHARLTRKGRLLSNEVFWRLLPD